VLSTSGSPLQRAYVERVIGTIRRDCLDHLLVSTERHLRHHLSRFIAYYHQSRTHLGLHKDAPEPRLN
jgi:transposase InsO family protein